MAIDNESVKKVAFLSRLRIEDDKIEDTKDEFNKILHWIEELNEVNTDNVDELGALNDLKLQMREDQVTAGNCREDILKNAPAAEYGYFTVPKVVE